MTRLLIALAATGVATAASAQAPALRQDLSTRATVEASFRPPRVAGQPAPTPLKVRIDYGQPHVRGRKIVGGLIPVDTVWRFGANAATGLTSEVDLVIGGKAVPKGAYSLFCLLDKAGAWSLIVSKKTGEWGTEYDPAADLVRIPVKARALPESAESFSISLVPAADGSPKGVLRFAWGTAEGTVDWSLKP